MCKHYQHFIFFQRVYSSNLTWRDVQHIVVRSSQPIRPAKKVRSASRPRPIWTENAAGLKSGSITKLTDISLIIGLKKRKAPQENS